MHGDCGRQASRSGLPHCMSEVKPYVCEPQGDAQRFGPCKSKLSIRTLALPRGLDRRPKVCEPRVSMVTCQELNFVDRDHLFCRPLPCARGCSSSALPTRSIMRECFEGDPGLGDRLLQPQDMLERRVSAGDLAANTCDCHRRVARGDRRRTIARCWFCGSANNFGYLRRCPRCDRSALSTPLAPRKSFLMNPSFASPLVSSDLSTEVRHIARLPSLQSDTIKG